MFDDKDEFYAIETPSVWRVGGSLLLSALLLYPIALQMFP